MQLFKIQSRKMLNAILCHVLVPKGMSYWAWHGPPALLNSRDSAYDALHIIFKAEIWLSLKSRGLATAKGLWVSSTSHWRLRKTSRSMHNYGLKPRPIVRWLPFKALHPYVILHPVCNWMWLMRCSHSMVQTARVTQQRLGESAGLSAKCSILHR